MQAEKAKPIIQTRSWSPSHRRLWRTARRQLLSQMTQDLSFDADGNWVGDPRPNDIKAYWEGLDETQRAFEKLQRTDAAVYMEFVDQIRRTMPEGVELTGLNPIVIEPK